MTRSKIFNGTSLLEITTTLLVSGVKISYLSANNDTMSMNCYDNDFNTNISHYQTPKSICTTNKQTNKQNIHTNSRLVIFDVHISAINNIIVTYRIY